MLPFVGFAAYFVMSILYIFPSGTPQPADYILVLVVIGTFMIAWDRIPADATLYLSAGLFLTWVVLVNVSWYLLIGDSIFLKKTSFYVYNLTILLFVIMAAFHDWGKLKRTVWWSCVIGLLIECAILLLVPDAARRSTGSFNNPNQLGYWALLMMACLAVTKEGERLGFIDVVALGAGSYAIMLSLSKAASLAAPVLLLAIWLTCGSRRLVGLALSAVLLMVLVLQIALGGLLDRIASLDTVVALSDRLLSIGTQDDDSLITRGYIRLIEFPEYLAFGAGEGAFDRLALDGRAKEFHSTIGNLVMSYGVIGLAAFVGLLFVVFHRSPLRNLLYLLPILLYGVTHMGLRFSMFWVFLGLVYAQGRYGKRRSPPDRWQNVDKDRPAAALSQPAPVTRHAFRARAAMRHY
jgi:hypothetical protein